MEKLALISVSNKEGLAEFARALVERHGYKILSTGGTAKLLREQDLPVTDISGHTGFPELMDGRIKTLHPKVHGGLLCRRDNPAHMAEAEQQGIALIDLLAVNLYPFEETVAKPDAAFEEAIENIDIGGPSMLRSAAKNHAAVTVICDPADYSRVLCALSDEEKLAAVRKELALKVFRRTAAYDKAISDYLETRTIAPSLETQEGLPPNYKLSLPHSKTLRYGENPHQKAALYGDFWSRFEQLQGKDLSYNNILDITAAINLIGEFDKPTLAILKHTNPCGAASCGGLAEAWEQALATDRQSPFGGIIIVNRALEKPLAEKIREVFCEVIIAPEFSPEARELFAKKKNLRLMTAKPAPGTDVLQQIRSAAGGILVQEGDLKTVTPEECKVVTKRAPTDEEWKAMMFGWKIVKHVKSNAIVYAAAERTLGIGAGQMSRVDASKLAVWKAGEAGLPLQGSIIASDAFFPFPDGLIAAAEAGATACIQPGGSVKDADVIAAANERNLAMAFTGVRHFRH